MRGLKARLKLPLLRHPVKGGMALEGPHPGRKQAEGDSATSVTVVDAVDERRQFLSPVVIGCDKIQLMVASGHEVEQHDADAERFVHWSCAHYRRALVAVDQQARPWSAARRRCDRA